jgi:flagellar basal-body rod protein FlgB
VIQGETTMPVSAPNVVDQVSAALALASLRHQVIASNVANRDSVGYQRLALRFADALGRDDAAAPRVVAEVSTSGAEAAAPSLEEDMLALSSNAMNYQALARALARYFTIAETVASGGRV